MRRGETKKYKRRKDKEEEEEEEEGKEKTTSGKRVKTKKWALANATNLQASMEDVNKACEEKIKKELEAASAQVLKSKRELETIELKLGVVEVERDAANKSKKNLQIELEKALARESRVLTCLDSLEMEVTGFAEACAEIGVLDSRVAKLVGKEEEKSNVRGAEEEEEEETDTPIVVDEARENAAMALILIAMRG